MWVQAKKNLFDIKNLPLGKDLTGSPPIIGLFSVHNQLKPPKTHQFFPGYLKQYRDTLESLNSVHRKKRSAHFHSMPSAPIYDRTVTLHSNEAVIMNGGDCPASTHPPTIEEHGGMQIDAVQVC